MRGPWSMRRRRHRRRDQGDCCAEAACCAVFDLSLLTTLLCALAARPEAVPARPGTRAATWARRWVRTYQVRVSAHRPAVCAMAPTCSAYAMTAIERHGAVRGAWLSLRRLLRCGRLAHGADPVPLV